MDPVEGTNLKSYVDWVEEKRFIIRGSYNPETDESTPVGPLMLLKHQKEILSHCLTQDPVTGKFPYTTVIYSATKKSGKTTIEASIGEWWLEEYPFPTEGYVIANDLEHAQGRVFADMTFSVKAKETAYPTKSRIEYPSGTFALALAQEYKSASGSRHSLTMWDELWGYMSDDSRRMWAEMTPIQIPGVPFSLRVIVTYAGFEGESDLLRDLYEQVVLNGEPVPELKHIKNSAGKPVCFRKGRMFAYWDTEPRMPWQTPEYYEEQMATLRPHEYLRLHENRWVSSDEQYIPIEWWDEATKRFETSLELDFKNKRRSIPVVIGVDGGVKRDSTAIVACQYDYATGMVDVAFHRIRTPTPDERVDLEQAVELYILKMNEEFRIVKVLYDPRELMRSMQTLSAHGIPCEEYVQTVNNMVAASGTLYELLRTQRLRAYPADDLREHMRFAVAEEKGQGFRIVKPDKRSPHHIDGAIALAMAVHGAIRSKGVDVSKPLRMEHPSSEISGWEHETAEKKMTEKQLPLALRDGNYNPGPEGGWRD